MSPGGKSHMAKVRCRGRFCGELLGFEPKRAAGMDRAVGDLMKKAIKAGKAGFPRLSGTSSAKPAVRKLWVCHF
jgi:hypothetical protein